MAFTVLWRAADRGALPAPLHYRSDFTSVSEYEAAWKAEAARLHSTFDEDLFGAVRVLAEPQARMEVTGFHNGDRLRIHAAVQSRYAVLLVQEPAGTSYRGGHIAMTMFDAVQLPHRLVAALPSTPRGRGPGVRVSREEAESDTGPGVDGVLSPRERAAQFFERPRTLVAHVVVRNAETGQTTPSSGFHVIDYPEGRYVVRNGGGLLQAEPVDRMGLQFDLERVIRFAVADQRDPSLR